MSSLRAASSATSSNFSNPTPAVPTGTADGDLLVMLVCKRNPSAAAWVFPAGWTILENANTGTIDAAIGYKIASSESGTYSPTHSGAADGAAIVMAFDIGGGTYTNSDSDLEAASWQTVADFTVTVPTLGDEQIVFGGGCFNNDRTLSSMDLTDSGLGKITSGALAMWFGYSLSPSTGSQTYNTTVTDGSTSRGIGGTGYITAAAASGASGPLVGPPSGRLVG